MPQDEAEVGGGDGDSHLGLQGSFCTLTQQQHDQLHTSSFQGLPTGPQSENQGGPPAAQGPTPPVSYTHLTLPTSLRV